MRVRVNFTIDIDADGWASEFGIEPHEVRADVKQHLAESIRTLLADRGLLVIEDDPRYTMDVVKAAYEAGRHEDQFGGVL